MEGIQTEHQADEESPSSMNLGKLTRSDKEWETHSNIPCPPDIDFDQDRYGKALTSSINLPKIICSKSLRGESGFNNIDTHLNPMNFATQTKAIPLYHKQPSNIDRRLFHSTKTSEVEYINSIRQFNQMNTNFVDTADPSLELYYQRLDQDQLSFEIRRLEKLMAVMKNELEKKSSTIKKLQAELNQLENYKKGIELEKESDQALNESRMTAKIVYKSAQIESLREQNEALEKRFSKMEELLRQKDSELRTLQQQAVEREGEFSKMNRDLQTLRFELSSKDSRVLALESQLMSRDDHHRNQCLSLEENFKQQIHDIEVQHEFESVKMYDKLSEIEQKNRSLEKRLEEARQKISNYETILQKANQEKKIFQNRLIDLEAELATANSQGIELEEHAMREKSYKELIDKLKTALRNMERKIEFLQSTNTSPIYPKEYISEHSENYQAKAHFNEYSFTHQNIKMKNNHMLSSPSSSSFPKPVELRQVFIEPVNSSSMPNKLLINNNKDWANIDKWKVEFI